MRLGIIGAGLSGRLLVLNALQQAAAGDRILLIDRGEAGDMGPAYSNDRDAMLLNVPAGIMGATPEDPEHFLEWARQRGIEADPRSFLPRSLYRDYILGLTASALREHGNRIEYRYIRAEAVDVETGPEGASVRLAGGEVIVVDRLVLALGNFAPPDPCTRMPDGDADGRYIRNPWHADAWGSMPAAARVLFIGTGQTMFDIAIALNRRGHTGRMLALSRHGQLPLAHPDAAQSYPLPADELHDATTLLALTRVVHGHVRRARQLGIDPRAVIDALRRHTPTLWSNLSANDRRRFLRHVFRRWERIRSRIPPRHHAHLMTMMDAGQLEILAGRIERIVESDAGMAVHYRPRLGHGHKEILVDTVINCTGPDMDYTRLRHPLLRNLRRRGLIRAGGAGLGMDTLESGALIDRSGNPSGLLFTLGSPMKGLLWETIAVPEIRLQAKNLAAHLYLHQVPGSPPSRSGDGSH